MKVFMISVSAPSSLICGFSGSREPASPTSDRRTSWMSRSLNTGASCRYLHPNTCCYRFSTPLWVRRSQTSVFPQAGSGHQRLDCRGAEYESLSRRSWTDVLLQTYKVSQHLPFWLGWVGSRTLVFPGHFRSGSGAAARVGWMSDLTSGPQRGGGPPLQQLPVCAEQRLLLPGAAAALLAQHALPPDEGVSVGRGRNRSHPGTLDRQL